MDKLSTGPGRRPSASYAVCVLAGFAAISSAGAARASCNIIPTASHVRAPAPFFEPSGLKFASVDMPTSFRGTRGWSDHRFAGPRDATLPKVEVDKVHLRVGLGEPQCKAPALEDADGSGTIDAGDYLVALVFGAATTDEVRRDAILVASAATCAFMEEQPSDWPAKRLTVLSCPNLVLRRCVSTSDFTVTAGGVAFEFPSATDLATSTGGHQFAGPTAMIAVEKPSADSREPLLPCALETARCADVLADGSIDDVGVCIDELYYAKSCETDANDVDPIVGHFVTLPRDNEFDRLCTESNGPHPCQSDADQAGTIELALDVDGDALIPMYWQKILDPTGNQKPTRRVEGSSSYPSHFPMQTARIDVPGEEFLEAEPRQERRVNGSKRPRFDIEPGSTAELELWGHADKPDSVLYIARRKIVRQVCADGAHKDEACEAAQLRCASDCGSNGKSRCDCIALEVPEFFICVDGPRHGKPCSRPSHCGGGKCRPEPPCTPDRCASLFDLRGQEQPGGKIVITREVAADDDISGICAGGNKKGRPCFQAQRDCDGFKCVRFRAVAGESVTTTTLPN